MKPLVEKARQLAMAYHRGQVYGSRSFFTNHLEPVVAVLYRYGETRPHVIAAGWLHDSLEDNKNVTIGILTIEVGKDTTDIVWRVTDEEGETRAERKKATYPKIRARPEAVIVKLADRIANVEHSLRSGNDKKLLMYRQEHDAFRLALYRPGEYDDMWLYLDAVLTIAVPLDTVGTWSI